MTTYRAPPETECRRQNNPLSAFGALWCWLFALLALLLGTPMPAAAQNLADPGFVPGWKSGEGAPSAFAIQSDGKILVAGTFDGATLLRRLNTDGSVDASFSVPYSGNISVIAVQADGRILVTGSTLSTLGGQPATHLSRLHADGTLDGTFTPDVNYVTSIAEQPDGNILIGGGFRSVNGAAIYKLARLKPDGTTDPTFATPITGPTSTGSLSLPYQVRLRADGKIYLSTDGSTFSMPSGNSDIARFNSDGSLDADLSSDTTAAGLIGSINSIALYPDGRLLIAGNVSGAGYTVIRLNADDTRDSGFLQQNADNNIWSLLIQPDGRVVVAGWFENIGPSLEERERHNHIVRLNADGSIDASFDPQGHGANSYVNALIGQLDGRLLIWGYFDAVGEEQAPRPGLARLLVPDAAVQQIRFGADRSSVLWERSGSGIEFPRVRFDYSGDGLTWAPLGEAHWEAPAIWRLDGLDLPAGEVWVRALAADNVAGQGGGHSGSLHQAVRQLVATITPSAGTGGSIAPDEAQLVDVGGQPSFTLTPDSGYQTVGVGGTCGGTLDGNVFTTVPIAANCTVEATFAELDRFIVTPSAGAGGSIAPPTPQAVLPGDTIAFTLTPDPGRALDQVGGTCGGTLDGNVFITAPITAHCTVEVSFAIIYHTVTASVLGEHGSVAPTSQSVAWGEAGSVTVTPEAGYTAQVSGCGGSLSGNVYTTAPVTEDCGIEVSFAEIQTGPYLEFGASTTNCVSTHTTTIINPGDSVRFCFIAHTGDELPMPTWNYCRDSLGNVPNSPFTFPATYYCGGQTSGTFWRPATVTATWVGLNDALPGYQYDDTVAFDWIELAGLPQAQRLPIDTFVPYADTQVQLPFSVEFFGYPTDGQLCVSKNGEVRFGAGASCAVAWNESSGTALLEQRLAILPALASLRHFGGDVYYAVLGTEPARRAVIEWSGTRVFGPGIGTGTISATDPITFQVLIDEADGAITFQYLEMDTGTLTANGAYAVSGLIREQVAYGSGQAPNPQIIYSPWGEENLTNRKAVRFTPTSDAQIAIVSQAEEVQIQIRGSLATVTPAALNVSAEPGGSATETLRIGNEGTRDLAWNLGELAGRSGFRIDTAYDSAATRLPERAWNSPMPSKAKPRSESSASPAKAGEIVPLGTAAVPAYGRSYFYGAETSRFLHFDAQQPDIFQSAYRGWSSIQTNAFLDNDFTQQYVVTNQYCNEGCADDAAAFESIADGSSSYVDSGSDIAPYLPGSGIALDWAGVKWDHATGTLYGIAHNGGPGGYPFGAACGSSPLCRSEIFTIDPLTARSTWVASIDPIHPTYGTLIADFAITPNGEMIAINMTDGTFYAIDKDTGHVRAIGAPSGHALDGWQPYQSMDFDQSTGTLYYAGKPAGETAGLFVVDTETGDIRLIGAFPEEYTAPAGLFGGVRGLAIAQPGGACLNPEDVPWLSLDATGGTVEPGASTQINVSFNAAGLAPGEHHAKICVNTNTWLRSTIAVPVTFTVGSSVFKDGFENPAP